MTFLIDPKKTHVLGFFKKLLADKYYYNNDQVE